MQAVRAKWFLAAVGALFAAIYVITAVRQAEELNLSLTAGGQYPYFQNAERMAAEGVANYWGDRNRMPLAPGLLSFLHSDDRAAFFQRGKVLAIVSSFVLLVALASAFFLSLPRWPAMFLTGLAAIHVSLPKASFVQAELAYYAFFFLAWLFMCAVIRGGRWPLAILAGAAAALAFYSKASATPMLALFLMVLIVRAIGRRQFGGLMPGAVVAAVFLMLVSPYLLDNQRRFGQYFYNVNSTFFMWTDSWSEAQEFARRYDIANAYPKCPPEELPSMTNYSRHHSAGQMWQRIEYGIRTVVHLAFSAPYAKYFIILLCALVLLSATRWTEVRLMLSGHRLEALFLGLILLAYATAYSWYTVVSYGDRFILSLYVPVMYGLTWFATKLPESRFTLSIKGRRIHAVSVLAAAMVFVLLVEGAAMATVRLPRPNERFVEFYFNESREAHLAGDVQVGVEGYRGVLRLDPAFAAAHHELAIVALQEGRAADAVESARAAAELDSANANYLNTYGSAFLQAGRIEEAIGVLERAVLADPRLVSAWYNLGVAFLSGGHVEDAEKVAERLEEFDTEAAKRLKRLLREQ